MASNIEQFDYWGDQFEQLPMYFMTFHGQEMIANVIDVSININVIIGLTCLNPCEGLGVYNTFIAVILIKL